MTNTNQSQKNPKWFPFCTTGLGNINSMVYCYMLNRYQYFNDLGKTYFESQDSIADYLEISKRSVNSSVKELEDKGFLKLDLVRKGKSFVNVYIIEDKFGIYDKTAPKQLKVQAQTGKPKKAIPTYQYDFDDPF